MPRILITGGAGFIGSHTADLLILQGHRVRVLDVLDPQIHGEIRGFPPLLNRRVDFKRGDVRDPKALAAALDDVEFVYHFAARTGVGQSMYDRAGYIDVNVGGTAALLDALIRMKNPVRRVVLSSSRAVYGEGSARCAVHGIVCPPIRQREDLDRGDFSIKCPRCRRCVVAAPTTESTLKRPGSVYALTKSFQEDLVLECARSQKIPVVILRYFNVYGSRQALNNPYTGVATVFFNRLRERKPISLYEKGLPTRDFIHVADVARANAAALNAALPAEAVFNVGSGRAHTIRELAVALAQQLGLDPQLEDRGEFRVGDIAACTADISHTKKQLKWKPCVGLARGLAEFIAWAKQRPISAGPGYDRTVKELKTFHLFGQARK